MDQLDIQFEWEDARGARGDELRASWARLEIRIGSDSVTEVLDVKTNSVRSGIYLPLYPLCEWIVENWWFLFHEVNGGNKTAYERRHNLTFAREGFALPNLTLQPSGAYIQLACQPDNLPKHGLRFVSGKSAILEGQAVEYQLRRIVEATIHRLEVAGVRGTSLQEEWRAIESADSDERAFCRIAAQLGLDPYNVGAGQEESIIAAAQIVPAELLDDFFSAASADSLALQSTSIVAKIEALRNLDVTLDSLVSLRKRLRVASGVTPWEEGYIFARQLRAELGLNGNVIDSMERLGEIFSVDSASWAKSQLPYDTDCRFVSALMAVNDAESPTFLIEKKRDESKKFAFCRALFEYLASSSSKPVALISNISSDRQKRNRAFAAEFLAPAHLLKKRISNSAVTEEYVDELANDFGVSEHVIQHQIENHRLAHIASEFNN